MPGDSVDGHHQGYRQLLTAQTAHQLESQHVHILLSIKPLTLLNCLIRAVKLAPVASTIPNLLPLLLLLCNLTLIMRTSCLAERVLSTYNVSHYAKVSYPLQISSGDRLEAEPVSDPNQVNVKSAGPLVQISIPEVDQQVFTREGIDNLYSIDNTDACHPFGVVRAQEQGQLDELIPAHPQLILYILHSVLLHVLLPLKDVPEQRFVALTTNVLLLARSL